jgi:uncharacterized DUF497 family protein
MCLLGWGALGDHAA